MKVNANTRFLAFSLIELLVVMVLVAIMASAAAPSARNRLIRARLESEFVPILDAYRRRLEDLFQDPQIPRLGRLCLLDQLPAFSATGRVRGLRMGYDKSSGYHVFWLTANMGNYPAGIGIAQIGGKDLMLRMRVRRLGLVSDVEYGCTSGYENLVPVKFRGTLLSGTNVSVAVGSENSKRTCATESSIGHIITVEQIITRSIWAWRNWASSSNYPYFLTCGCVDDAKHSNLIRIAMASRRQDSTVDDEKFVVALHCDPNISSCQDPDKSNKTIWYGCIWKKDSSTAWGAYCAEDSTTAGEFYNNHHVEDNPLIPYPTWDYEPWN